MYQIAISLPDGSGYREDRQSMPKHWKSAAMRLAPYGTDVRGARLELYVDRQLTRFTCIPGFSA